MTAPDVFARARGLRRAARATLAATMVISALGTVAQAQPTKEQYELQERCGKDAAAFFKRFDDGGGPAKVSFTDHYNPDLNGCFVLLNRTGDWFNNTYTAWWELWDVNENRQIDVMGIGAEPGDKTEHVTGTSQPTFEACVTGNFVRCGDRGDYAKGFATAVQTYMQRSTP